MTRNLLSFILLLGLLGNLSCGTKPESVSQNSNEITTDKTLDGFFRELEEKDMFSGAVAVKKNGKILLKKGYGKANFQFDKDFKANTPMEVASVSKQFTAAAIVLLEQQSKLNIEDNVQTYLDDFPYSEITIKHLLTHTSGLVNYASHFRKNWDTTKVAYNKDIISYFKTKKPDLESVPGEKYSYSNSGYVVLAEIIARVSGEQLDEFLHKNIFQPADMRSSAFYERDTIWKMKNYAPAYMLDLKTCAYTKPENLPGKYYYTFLSGRLGPGRLSSSINDLVKWDSILNTNAIFSEKSKQKIFQVYKPEKDSSDYGFGWHIYNDDSLGKVVYHTGSWAGNLTSIKRYIDDKSLIVVLNNRYNIAYLKDIRKQVEGYLKGQTLEVPKQKIEHLLQKEICNLNKENLYSWYESIADEAEISLEALADLEKEYLEIDEPRKANLAKDLSSFITNSN